jgi:hypothetical protein
MGTPLVSHAQVVSVDSVHGALNVVFQSIQMPGLSVRMLRHGYADTLRVHQAPMPTPGTWGIVLFPYGDSRNGVWLGSYYSQGNDALYPGPSEGPADPDIAYEAHASGAWSLIDGAGNTTLVNADGSSAVIGNSGTIPAVTRNVVNAQQQRKPMVYPQSTRRKSTPTPLPWTISIADEGTITVSCNKSTMQMDKTGNINFNLADGAEFNITQGGTASDSLTLVSALVSFFNAHTHGHGPVPDVAMTATDVKSVLAEVEK